VLKFVPDPINEDQLPIPIPTAVLFYYPISRAGAGDTGHREKCLRPVGAFRLLDYYIYSTNNAYLSGHLQVGFRKLLLTHLPGVRVTGIKENIFMNYLKTSPSPHYYELGYSLDNVLRVFRIEGAAAFTDRRFKEAGFRIGIATLIHFNTD
jgi:hypothetical protein